MTNPNYSFAERELLLTQTAAVRKPTKEHAGGVVLVPSGRLLCKADEEDAKLIVKIFNHAEIVRPGL